MVKIPLEVQEADEYLVNTASSFMNPACSFLRSLSTVSEIWWMNNNFCKIIDERVMLQQLLQLLRSPYFGIFTLIPSVQSSGIFFHSHMASKIAHRNIWWYILIWKSVLSLSYPGALFLFLRNLMVEMISSFSGGTILTSRSISALGDG